VISRTNIFILIATALLGVLLIVVLGMFQEVFEPPPSTSPPPLEVETAADMGPEPDQQPETAPPSLGDSPLVTGRESLVSALDSMGLDGEALVMLAAAWYRNRGYPATSPLLNSEGDDESTRYYDSLDDPTLESMAGAGDMDAMQTLAARHLLFDPVIAVDWYRQAASHGSVYAILQIASLYDTFSNTALDAFNSDEFYLSRLAELRGNSVSLEEDALAWSLAAIGAGGEAAVQDGVAEWISRMTDNLDPGAVQRACRQSERKLLDIASEGRDRGQVSLSGNPPAVFVAPQGGAESLPCDDLRPLVDTSRCEPHSIVDARRGPATLYVCIS
jgi:hypothetical protein